MELNSKGIKPKSPLRILNKENWRKQVFLTNIKQATDKDIWCKSITNFELRIYTTKDGRNQKLNFKSFSKGT